MSLATHLPIELERLADIAPLSPVAVELVATLERDVSVSAVEAVIRRDPVIAARVLSAANAAAWATSAPVVSIHAALLRLGFERVRRLAVLISLYDAVASAPVARSFWRHSISVAHVAEALARRVSETETADIALVGGLLHDIGLLVLSRHYASALASMRAAVEVRGVPLWDVEREALGIDHAELGASVAIHWRLSPSIADAIRYHHHPDAAPPEAREVARVLALADSIASAEPAWNLHEGGPAVEVDRAISLDPQALAELLDVAREEARRATLVLETIG